MGAPADASAGYITVSELREFAPGDTVENLSDNALALMIQAGKEMIDSHCKSCHIVMLDPVPAIVKTVNTELVRVLAADSTKSSESISGYSYSRDQAAVSRVLARLDFLAAGATTRKEVTVSIV